MKISSLLFTLQLAHAVKPMFFSDTQYFSVAANDVLPGRSLTDATFKVYFDKPVIEFDEADISVQAFFCADSVCKPALGSFQVQVTAWQAIPGKQQYQFKLNTDNADFTTNDLSTVQLVLSTADGGCQAEATLLNCEASAYNIYYANGLSTTSATSIDEQQVHLNLNFDLDYFNLNGAYFPFEVTVNGVAAAFGSYDMIMTNNELNATYYGAETGDKVCLETTTGILPAVGNSYGDYISQESYTPVCFEVSSEPCKTFSWSEWSGCAYECKPAATFDSDNVQTRTKVYPDAGCDIDTERRICQISYTTACKLRINKADETGLECHPIGDNPRGDPWTTDTCNVGKLITGCECGGDCASKGVGGTCCQSFYEHCLVDAKNDPALFYKYAPCWEPHTCTVPPVEGDIPYCDNTKTAISNNPGELQNSVLAGYKYPPFKSGSCDPLAEARGITRAYKYRCTCFGVIQSDLTTVETCNDLGYCCGGWQSFANSCPQ